MILDALLKLAENLALSGAGGLSTNVIDLGDVTPRRDIGVGEPMDVTVGVDVAAAAGGTYLFEVVQSDSSDMSGATVVVSATVLAASLIAGAAFALTLPQGGINKRYLALRATLGGTTPTITITSFLQPRSMSSVTPKHYADAITIG